MTKRKRKKKKKEKKDKLESIQRLLENQAVGNLPQKNELHQTKMYGQDGAVVVHEARHEL